MENRQIKKAPLRTPFSYTTKILFYSTFILISFFLASSDFGSVIFKIPFLKDAVILSL
jgi:hypothetical protein